MNPSRWTNRGLLVLLALGLLLGLYPLQARIDRVMPREPVVLRDLEGPTTVLIAAVGGFRGVAANLLWLKIDELWHGGDWWQMIPLFRAVVSLDPHFLMAWETYGWHCAWNLNNLAETALERRAWLDQGIDIYRDGIRANPDKIDLYLSLAWLYYNRVKEYDQAEPIYIFIRDKFPNRSRFQVDHTLAHLYENNWRVADAVAVWRDCLRYDSTDRVARSALEWWSKHWNDPAWRQKLLLDENNSRRARSLPPFHYGQFALQGVLHPTPPADQMPPGLPYRPQDYGPAR
jgi:tetratricopeptide (TPR) repeat protein